MGLFRKSSKEENDASRFETPKSKFSSRLKSFFKRQELTPEFWDEFEEILLSSDVGLETTEKIIASVKNTKTMDALKEQLCHIVTETFKVHQLNFEVKPTVIMVVGVNGAGKTTTIAKLTHQLKSEGKSVMLVAADTFRAAAIDQLKVWGDRLGVTVVAQQPDSDPAAVAFDGIQSAIAKGVDVVILDTAGRLHTNKNLMEELTKIKRVSGKALDGAPHEILLLLDATVGQNGLNQAQTFNEALGLTGAIIAKMDGTAKGGVILAIADQLSLPISYIGVGETLEDLEPFDPARFIGEIVE